MALEAADIWYGAVQAIKVRDAAFDELQEYWTGEQDLPISSAEFQSRFGVFFAGFRDNLTRPILEAAQSRIRIRGFGPGDQNEVHEMAWDIWHANRMQVESNWVHEQAMLFGEAYVIVLPMDDDAPGIYPQIASQCVVLFDDVDPRERVVGMKWWVEDRSPNQSEDLWVRVNLYWPDRIERYESITSSNLLEDNFERYRPYEDESGGYVVSHPLGEVPMFRFTTNYDLTEQSGRSDLADALPLIDAINKEMLDMMVASEYTAAPQRWATGVEIPLDPQTGEPMETYKSGADRLWTAPNEQARFGQFGAGSLDSYKNAIEVLVDHLAFITRTPQYVLFRMADYPSGEALKVIEAGLRARVQEHQDELGAVWAEVVRAALSLAGGGDIALRDVVPIWLPPNAPFATMEHLEELKVKSEVLGVPDEMLWEEAGYSPEQIERMKEMREEEAQVGLDAADQIAANLLAGSGVNESQEAPVGADAGLTPEE